MIVFQDAFGKPTSWTLPNSGPQATSGSWTGWRPGDPIPSAQPANSQVQTTAMPGTQQTQRSSGPAIDMSSYAPGRAQPTQTQSQGTPYGQPSQQQQPANPFANMAPGVYYGGQQLPGDQQQALATAMAQRDAMALLVNNNNMQYSLANAFGQNLGPPRFDYQSALQQAQNMVANGFYNPFTQFFNQATDPVSQLGQYAPPPMYSPGPQPFPPIGGFGVNQPTPPQSAAPPAASQPPPSPAQQAPPRGSRPSDWLKTSRGWEGPDGEVVIDTDTPWASRTPPVPRSPGPFPMAPPQPVVDTPVFRGQPGLSKPVGQRTLMRGDIAIFEGNIPREEFERMAREELANQTPPFLPPQTQNQPSPRSPGSFPLSPSGQAQPIPPQDTGTPYWNFLTPEENRAQNESIAMRRKKAQEERAGGDEQYATGIEKGIDYEISWLNAKAAGAAPPSPLAPKPPARASTPAVAPQPVALRYSVDPTLENNEFARWRTAKKLPVVQKYDRAENERLYEQFLKETGTEDYKYSRDPTSFNSDYFAWEAKKYPREKPRLNPNYSPSGRNSASMYLPPATPPPTRRENERRYAEFLAETGAKDTAAEKYQRFLAPAQAAEAAATEAASGGAWSWSNPGSTPFNPYDTPKWLTTPELAARQENMQDFDLRRAGRQLPDFSVYDVPDWARVQAQLNPGSINLDEFFNGQRSTDPSIRERAKEARAMGWFNKPGDPVMRGTASLQAARAGGARAALAHYDSINAISRSPLSSSRPLPVTRVGADGTVLSETEWLQKQAEAAEKAGVPFQSTFNGLSLAKKKDGTFSVSTPSNPIWFTPR